MADGKKDGKKEYAKRKKMREQLRQDKGGTKKYGWDKLWKDGVTPWDLLKPTPVLEDELRKSTLGNSSGQRVLVPGCGSGFDLITMAEQLPNSVVVGLDISRAGLERAEQVLTERYQGVSNSTILLVEGDFFDATTWKTVYSTSDTSISTFPEASFDLIYDYVFFCALPPSLREAWGASVRYNLKPSTGRLLTLMFPILPWADPTEGPPYPIFPLHYEEVLVKRAVVQESERCQSPHTVPERKEREMVQWWRRKDSKQPSDGGKKTKKKKKKKSTAPQSRL